MGWIFLLLGGALEVAFTTAIRYTDGFTKFLPTTIVLALAAISIYFVSKSSETIPLGTAYAAWGGIGAIGTVVVGVLYYGEPVTFGRMFFLSLLIISLAGLKLVTD
ncbi:DMT family transporter [Hyphomicrobium sp.]|uniref:DMT family transporter n=1 Tax=Hyphomicrobium sp. TaxID=82 RepID=UPI002FDD1FA2